MEGLCYGILGLSLFHNTDLPGGLLGTLGHLQARTLDAVQESTGRTFISQESPKTRLSVAGFFPDLGTAEEGSRGARSSVSRIVLRTAMPISWQMTSVRVPRVRSASQRRLFICVYVYVCIYVCVCVSIGMTHNIHVESS